MFVQASNLTNLGNFRLSDPQCQLRIKEANNDYAVQRTVGETEVIQNDLNPEWKKDFTVIYQFNKDSLLLFQVWHFVDPKNKTLIGEVECRLTEIIMAEG